MATVIVMPRLSPTMEEGVLLKWTKKAGDKINPGDVIAEVETDKANMDFPLEDEGTLLKLLVAEGDSVKLGAPVAVLGEPGEDAEAALQAGAGKGAEATTAAAPVAGGGEARGITSPAAPTAVAAAATSIAASAPAAPAQPEPAPSSTGVKASPVARKLAFEKGVDLKTVRGSGPNGRVVKRDIEEAAARPAPVAARQAPVKTLLPAPVLEDKVIPLTPMRRTIARRLTESKSQVPHFYVKRDVKGDALAALHAQLKEAAPELKITLNDLIIKAVATALARLPEANASFTDQGIVRHGGVHVGIAVSIDDGLVTPVLRDAHKKSIGQIAVEARDLIERARARKLRGDEFTGSTFSVSNMGMLGVKEFSAVINPPDSGILAVGTLDKRAVVETDGGGHDQLVVRRVMTLTLSADHRVLDGALAAKLLGEIVKVLETPLVMVL